MMMYYLRTIHQQNHEKTKVEFINGNKTEMIPKEETKNVLFLFAQRKQGWGLKTNGGGSGGGGERAGC